MHLPALPFLLCTLAVDAHGQTPDAPQDEPTPWGEWWRGLWEEEPEPQTAAAPTPNQARQARVYLMGQVTAMCATAPLVDEPKDRVRVVVPGKARSPVLRSFAGVLAPKVVDACTDPEALRALLYDPQVIDALAEAEKDPDLGTWVADDPTAQPIDAAIRLRAMAARHAGLVERTAAFVQVLEQVSVPACEATPCPVYERLDALRDATDQTSEALSMMLLFAKPQQRLTTTYEGTVTEANGATTHTVGDRCILRMQERTDLNQLTCRVSLTCEGEALYGGASAGFGICRRVGNRYVGMVDQMPSYHDSDPQIRIDAAAGTVEASDAFPEWSVVVEIPPATFPEEDAEPHTPAVTMAKGAVYAANGPSPVEQNALCEANVVGRPYDPVHNCSVTVRCGEALLYDDELNCRVGPDGAFDGVYDPATSVFDGTPSLTWDLINQEITLQDSKAVPVDTGVEQQEYTVYLDLR